MKKHIPCLILTIILAGLVGFLDCKLITSKLLPTKLAVLLTVLLILILLLVAVMLWSTRRKALFAIGCVLWLLFAAVIGYGTYMLTSALQTMNNITTVKTEIAHVGIYVLNSDPAQTLQDASAYNFGILEELDRENTNSAVTHLEDAIGTSIQKTAYASPSALADALCTGDCNAVILNAAFLELIAETSSYPDFEAQIRELTTVKVEQIVEVPVTTEPIEIPQEQIEAGVFTMFISGIDTYGDISFRSRSDTNILAVINPSTHQILLLSTPRDYYVPLSFNGYYDKLTHAGIYGVQCSMDTLSLLYNTPIDYYFRVNFSGFEEIIDSLGGVSVYSAFEFTSKHGGYHFTEGYNDMNGNEALCFARERYSFSDGDAQRGKNQMEVIKAVIKKMLSPAILTNYNALLAALEGSFDTNMPYDKLAELVSNQLQSASTWEMVTASVSGDGNFRDVYSASEELYVMIPDYDTVNQAIDTINRIRNSEILSN